MTAQIRIEPDELRELLDRQTPVIVLDVRPAQDRAEWAIPDSIHLDAYAALKAGDPAALAGLDLPRDRPVVTVCGAGQTSLIAAEQLRARGIAARTLAGGMKAWSLAWNSAEASAPTGTARIVQLRRTGKGCLSYLIGDAGEAAVIDAALDPGVYQALAAQHGWTITRILDTHVHADHVSRARALAARTGAPLHLPAQDRVGFAFASLHEGGIVPIGHSRLVALRTPGHTLESTCYVLDGGAVFTGDTLFLDGIGRPDLDASPTESRERAHLLFASLRRLGGLPAATLVWPGHTSRPVPFDGVPVAAPLGEVLAKLAVLRLDEEAFVETILARIPPTPPNHATIVALNESGDLPDGDLTDLEAGANRCAIS